MEQPVEEFSFHDFKLRRWRADDVDAVSQAIEGSRDHLLPWSTLTLGDSREVATDLVNTALKEWEDGSAYKYAITVGSVVVGGCGLMRRIGPGGLEIGYWLHGDWTGQGLVTRAVEFLIETGFTLEGVDRLEIRHDAANTSSAGVPMRLNFEEVRREAVTEGTRQRMPGECGIEVTWRKTRP
jgi:RimJ/RimL family protein N-acetyltransferase